MLLGPFLHKPSRCVLHCARWGCELLGSCGLLLALPPNPQLDKSTWVMEEKLVCILGEVNVDFFFFFFFLAFVKLEGRQKENKACWCEGKGMPQLGHISLRVGWGDLCCKIWVADAKSAGHNQHMLTPLFKIICDDMLNCHQGSSAWYMQRQHHPAAIMERDIACLTSQLRKNSPSHSSKILGNGQSNLTVRTDLSSVDVKITAHNITVKLPTKVVGSWQQA